MSHSNSPIIIMAGGTGGHVFPALAIADELKKQGESIIWMGTKKGLEARVVPEAGYNVEWLSVNGLRGKGILTLLLAPFKMLQALIQAGMILVKHKPKAVLGMGGFVSGPGGIMSWLMSIPLFVHEQNAVVGLTNQWLSRICTNVFYGFPLPKKLVRAGLYVGNPVRAELIGMSDNAESKGLNLLIIGGSLGAAHLNKTVPSALQILANDQINVIHQCGERHLEMTEKAYQGVSAKYQIKTFINDMQEAYQWADFIVCRSGALTVAEVTNVGLASILVPYPYAVDNHQLFNAQQLKQANAAKVIKDKDLTAEVLAAQLTDCFINQEKRKTMAKNALFLAKPEATKTVIKEILQAVQQ